MNFNFRIDKPTKRHKLRRSLGKYYYTFRRLLKWYFDGVKYTRERSHKLLPWVFKEHQSFLLRPLKGVLMQLQYNKITNLRIAINHLDGIVLKPGEVFSFWKLVGKPSKSKGYLPGLVLNQGNIEEGTGGGLCQLGNLIFWMTIHSPLSIKERYRHGYDVFPDINRNIPFGAGATLSYNYIDIQVENKTDQSFQFRFWLSEEYLHGEIRGEREPQDRYEIYEAYHQMVHQWWGGYTRHNQINRKIFNLKTNQVVEDSVLVENHAIMRYEPLLPEGDASSNL